MPYRRSSGRSTSCRVYIGNLSSRIHIDEIKHFFRRYSRRFDILLKNGFAFIVSVFFSVFDFLFTECNIKKSRQIEAVHAKAPHEFCVLTNYFFTGIR